MVKAEMWWLAGQRMTSQVLAPGHPPPDLRQFRQSPTGKAAASVRGGLQACLFQASGALGTTTIG